ncbi:hypothetical protein [Nocardioides sp. zg-DK7169]|uniref:hypothetical protein n=1 Tax=Nocardioides sp. zg-DK7169 TaxID=2736600 RepID=UPI001554EF69|nr:hypothetical protein [Nocardioides sp. zg-DK7169]NPC96604.1 hypothetical protein [Nocardioides sp. zg-DK7169]
MSAVLKVVLARQVAPVQRVALTLEEAGNAVGLSGDTMRQQVLAGRLRAKRSKAAGRGRVLVSPEALRAWFDALPDA